MEIFRKTSKYIYSLIAVIAGIIPIFTLASNAGACETIGTWGMTSKSLPALVVDPVLPDVGSRKYTVMELFGNSYHLATPHGETKGGLIRGKNHTVTSTQTVSDAAKARLKESGKRTFIECEIGSNVHTAINEFTSGITEALTSLVRFVILAFFDSGLICDENNTKGCVDLLGLTGGTTETEGAGLIGKLGKGVFVPLVVMAFLFTAGWMAYEGLYKRQFRSSLGGLLWALFAFVLGLSTVYKPWLIARAPHEANAIVSGCLLNVLAGGSCISEGDTFDKTADQACTSYSDGTSSPNSKSQFALNTIACNITKGFTIDRWSVQQFGYTFDQLYTQNPPEGYSVYKVDKPEDFCINMYSESSPNSIISAHLSSFKPSNNVQVCNIAAAYMAATTLGDYGGPGMDRIVAVAAEDETMWQAMRGDNRDLIGISQILAILIIAISFIPIAVVGLAYSVLSSIMMIFAAVFLLFAIHPGRGKKIFLGWLETTLSYIMKYLAIGLLIIVMLALYQAAFANTTGMMTLIVSLIFATAFLLYRKEVTNLIGDVSLGGVKMANKAGQLTDKLGKKTGQMGAALAGGYIGGELAARSADSENPDETPEEKAQRHREARKQGRGKAFDMEMRRGRGFVANAARTQQQVRDINEKELRKAQEDERKAGFRDEVLGAMGTQTQELSSAMERSYIDNQRQKVLSNVSNAKMHATNNVIQSALDNVANSVETADTVDNMKAASIRSTVTINEIMTADKFLKEGSSLRADTAMKNYADSIQAKFSEDVTNIADSMKEDLIARGATQEEAANRVERFMNTSIAEIDNARAKIDGAIGVKDTGHNGRKVLTEINVDTIVDSKADFSNKINKLKEDILSE